MTGGFKNPIQGGGGGGSGDVVGPASSTDNAITRYDGTTGKLLQDSGVLLDDSGNITGAATGLTISTATNGNLTLDPGGSGTTTVNAGSGGVAITTDAGNANITLTPHGTGDVIVSSGTASEIAIFDASKGLQGADVATYPSLTELSYLKGVTSSIQAQIDADLGGDVVGPGSSTDNALARFDSTTGKLIQNSGITVDDSNNVSGAGIDLANNTVTGSVAEFNTALQSDSFATLAGADTYTGVKTHSEAVNENKGANIVAAATTNIGAGDGNYINILPLATITAFDTIQAGTRRVLHFTAATTLTHNATSLILPTGANITTAAGDVATFISEGSGNWRCTNYQRADGTALDGITASSTDTLTNKTFDANGTGNSISNIDVADLANGTDGELITWDATGAPSTVAVGTSGHVLTSNGAGAAPTFQAASGGSSSAPLFQVNVAGTQIVQELYTFVCNGAITAGTFRASLGTLCTGADFIIKLYKNGTEDASITIATTDSATNGLYQGTDTTFVSGSYAANDVLTVEVTQVGSSVAGADLTFSLYE